MILYNTSIACEQRTITHAYHTHCLKCAGEKKICAKCHGSTGIVEKVGLTTAELIKLEKEEADKISMLSERQRRSYIRKVESGDTEGAEKILNLDAASADDDFDDEL